MERIEPPCQFGACHDIRFRNGDFVFTFMQRKLWGRGSWIEDDYGAHIEGRLILKDMPAGAPVLVDIIENPNYGIFTITHPQVFLVQGWHTILVRTHRSEKLESLRSNHIQLSEATLTLKAHERGVLQLRRTGENLWGPQSFRGREMNAGIMTVFL